MILSDTGDWVPPEPNWPNLEDLMLGASLDVLKIQRARLAVNSMGDDFPLLPPAMVAAAFNVVPQEYWPFEPTPPAPQVEVPVDDE